MIVHCATQATGNKDVVATKNLIAAARRAGVGHIIYVSIVGIDAIPLPYYKTKLRVEEALAASGVGHTVLRATQFHDLINAAFSVQRFSPVLLALRKVRFQPIDTGDVAARVVELIDAEPAGRVADIGGPAVHEHTDLGRIYLAARKSRRRVVGVGAPGRIVAGYRSGGQPGAKQPGRRHHLRGLPRAGRLSLPISSLRHGRLGRSLAISLACASVRRRLVIDEHSSVAERSDTCC